jgi:hypothetical protein
VSFKFSERLGLTFHNGGIEKVAAIDYWSAVRSTNAEEPKLWQAVVLITRMSALSIVA